MTLAEQTITIKSLVFERVLASQPRPTELIRELSSEAHPVELENALSVLLDEGAITFGSDGRLRATETPVSAS